MTTSKLLKYLLLIPIVIISLGCSLLILFIFLEQKTSQSLGANEVPTISFTPNPKAGLPIEKQTFEAREAATLAFVRTEAVRLGVTKSAADLTPQVYPPFVSPTPSERIGYDPYFQQYVLDSGETVKFTNITSFGVRGETVYMRSGWVDDSSKQGAVFLTTYFIGDPKFKLDVYIAPKKVGSLTIKARKGLQATVVSEDGFIFIFDVENLIFIEQLPTTTNGSPTPSK